MRSGSDYYRFLSLFVSAIFTVALVACSDDTTPKDTGVDQPRADFSTDVGPGVDQMVDTSPDDAGPPEATLPIDVGTPTETCSCELFVTKINNAPTLPVRISSQDDVDPQTEGIQINVLVQSRCATDGLEVELDVTGLSPKPKLALAGGYAEFKAVTIGAATAVAEIKPVGTGCTGTAFSVNVIPDPTCTFSKPTDGATLTAKDDTVPNNGTFDYTIEVTTTNAKNGTVVANFASIAGPGSSNVDAVTGAARWVNQPIQSGQRELTATVEVDYGGGLKLTAPCMVDAKNKLTFTVDTAAPTCQLSGDTSFEPAAKKLAAGGYGLGPLQDGDTGAENLQSKITVTTDTGKSIEVSLEVGGQVYGPTTTTNGKATFDVTFTNGSPSMRASCTDTASKNSGQSGILKPIVDTEPPSAVTDLSCTINTALGHHRSGTLTCTWTNATDNGGSGIASYALHCSKDGVVDDSNFDSAPIKAVFGPAPPPSQTVELKELNSQRLFGITDTVRCAIKPRDFVENEAAISNLPPANTFAYLVREIRNDGPDAAVKDWFSNPMVVGNFNCDQWPDIAVGMQRANSDLGEVWIFFGHATGFSSQVVKIAGSIASQKLGGSLAVGDFNGDSCSDLAVRTVTTHRRVYVYLGRVGLSSRTDVGQGDGADLIYVAAAGSTLAEIAAGDFDGDSIDEIAIGYRDGSGNGSVAIAYGDSQLALLGAADFPPLVSLTDTSKIDVTLTGGTDALFTGGMIGVRGISGSKHGTFIVPQNREALTGGGQGAVYLVHGADRQATHETIDITAGGSRVDRLVGGPESDRFGTKVATADFDQDGTPELIVSDPRLQNASNVRVGRVYIFNTKPSMPTSISDATTVINNADPEQGRLGITLTRNDRVGATGSSLLGDDTPDLIVATWRTEGSSVFIFDGSKVLTATSTDDASLKMTPADSTRNFGQQLILIGDHNADGHQDLAIADTYWPEAGVEYGRVQIFY